MKTFNQNIKLQKRGHIDKKKLFLSQFLSIV